MSACACARRLRASCRSAAGSAMGSPTGRGSNLGQQIGVHGMARWRRRSHRLCLALRGAGWLSRARTRTSGASTSSKVSRPCFPAARHARRAPTAHASLSPADLPRRQPGSLNRLPLREADVMSMRSSRASHAVTRGDAPPCAQSTATKAVSARPWTTGCYAPAAPLGRPTLATSRRRRRRRRGWREATPSPRRRARPRLRR